MNWIATNENRRHDIEQCSNADRKCDSVYTPNSMEAGAINLDTPNSIRIAANLDTPNSIIIMVTMVIIT